MKGRKCISKNPEGIWNESFSLGASPHAYLSFIRHNYMHAALDHFDKNNKRDFEFILFVSSQIILLYSIR